MDLSRTRSRTARLAVALAATVVLQACTGTVEQVGVEPAIDEPAPAPMPVPPPPDVPAPPELVDPLPGARVPIGAGHPLVEQLVQQYPCGFGFWSGNNVDELALRIDLGDVTGLTRVEYELPDGRGEGSRAELLFGRDLHANWCDDVVEAGEPEPVVDETWSVVGGRLTAELPGPNGGVATARVLDLAVEDLDGTRIELGDVELVNDGFGIFAG